MDVHAKTKLNAASIFESMSQYVSDDPATMRPLFDRLLVRDVPDAEKSAGGIILTAAPSLGGLGKAGRIRIGDVVAVGKGDPWYNWTEKGKVKTRTYPCPNCSAYGSFHRFWGNGTSHDFNHEEIVCPRCQGRGHSHVDLIVKPGDRIVIDRRKEAEIYIEGERYTLCHEQQAVYGRMAANMVHVPSAQARDRAELLFGGYIKQEFEPIYDRVLIEPLAPVQVGAVIRPATAKQDQFREGIVRAAGQGFRGFDGRIHPLGVKAGDKVLYRAEGGAQRAEDITLFGEGLLIMREKLIVAVLCNATL